MWNISNRSVNHVATSRQSNTAHCPALPPGSRVISTANQSIVARHFSNRSISMCGCPLTMADRITAPPVHRSRHGRPFSKLYQSLRASCRGLLLKVQLAIEDSTVDTYYNNIEIYMWSLLTFFSKIIFGKSAVKLCFLSCKQCCGSKYIEFGSGSGSRILAQFGSGSRVTP